MLLGIEMINLRDIERRASYDRAEKKDVIELLRRLALIKRKCRNLQGVTMSTINKLRVEEISELCK